MIKVYALLNPITNRYFYVGITGQLLKKRLSGHMSTTDKDKNKVQIIKSIVAAGLRPEIVLLDQINEAETCTMKEVELNWINRLKTDGHEIINKSLSGAGRKADPNAKVAITLYIEQSIIDAYGGVEKMKEAVYGFIRDYEPDAIAKAHSQEKGMYND